MPRTCLILASKLVTVVALWIGFTSQIYAQNIVLVPDQVDTTEYGHQYGTNAHQAAITFQISGCSGSASLAVSGYDIESSSEIRVSINDAVVGYLSKGRGNGSNRLNNGDDFSISAASDTSYFVTFQQTQVGDKWGVTNILLSGCMAEDANDGGDNPDDNPDPSFIELSSTINTSRFGHNYGSNQNYSEIVFSFNNSGVNQTLNVYGYDVNSGNEIQVLLNGGSIGYLSSGRKRKLNSGDEFEILASDQSDGLNLITFRQTRTGNTWGVTNLQLIADTNTSTVDDSGQDPVPLQFNIVNNGQFGNQFGSGDDMDEASFSFNEFGSDIYISVHGFDIDTKKEVQVELNSEIIGHLTKGDNLSDNGGDVFVIPADKQISDINIVTFKQTKNSGQQWGVTKLQLLGCEYQVNGTAAPANSGTPTVIDEETGTVIFANFFNSGAISDGTDRYVSVCVSSENAQGDRFAHFTTDVGQDNNIQIKAYPEFIIGTKFGLVGETSFRPFPGLSSDTGFVYPALDAVSSLVGVPAFTNNLPDIDILLDIDEQNVFGSIRDVMLESWFYDTNANPTAVGNHNSNYSDWTPYTPLPPMDASNTPDFKTGDSISGTLNNIVGAGHANSTLRNILLEMMVHVGPLSPNDISYNPNSSSPDRNPARYRLTSTPVTIGDYQYHIWYGSTYLGPLVVYSRETNILGQSLLNLTEEGEINLDWNEFLDYTLNSLEPRLAAAGVSWATAPNNIFPRMRAATGAIGGIEFGIEPQTNGTTDEPYRATVRKFEVFIKGRNFGL